MFNPLPRFRIVAIAEGISYVVLVGIGMPLKYLADKPGTVEVVGWIHGVLFITYVLFGIAAAAEGDWSKRFMAGAFVAALVPGGTFLLDRYLRPSTDASSSSDD